MTSLPLDSRTAELGDARSLLVTLADNAGLLRAKLVPAAKIRAAQDKGIGLSPLFAVMAADSSITVSSHYGGPSGDMRLIPDLDAAACIDPSRGLWWAPVDQRNQELEVLSSCQRSALRRQCAQAKEAGFEYLMTFELEFTVLSGTREDPDFAHHGPSYGMQAFVELEDFILELTEQFERSGLDPELVHPEYGPGQVEFSTGPTDPVTAADRQVLARVIAHRVARAHGLRVSFSPVTALGAVGNGCHVHVSAFRNGQNAFAGEDGQPGPIGGEMMGALVKHLPETTGLFAPSPLSYERLVPGHWAGAYACWGVENREAAVRFIPGTITSRATSANCEIKIADNTCNPYLVAAAVVAMTLRGAAEGTALPQPMAGDPHELTPSEREAAGVRRLPTSTQKALDALAVSNVASAALGPELLDAFVAVRRRDLEVFGSLEAGERIAAMRWLY